MTKYRSIYDGTFRLIKGILTYDFEVKWNIGFSKMNKRLFYDSVMRDESPTKVIKFEIQLDAFNSSLALPVLNNRNFIRVYHDSISEDNEPNLFDFLNPEITLFKVSL